MSESPPALDLSWMDLGEDLEESTTALAKQADDLVESQKSDLVEEEPDAIDAWITGLAERLQESREGNRDLLIKAGYSPTEADDLMASSADAPTAEALMIKAGCRPRIQQGRNGTGPE